MNQISTLLTIDLAALADNYRIVQQQAGTAVQVGASIKADAYGLGAAQPGRILNGLGCRHYFVANIAEGVALRPHVEGHIYVFGGIRSGNAADLAAHRLTPVLNSLHDIAAWQAGPCAIQFDTGMNRLGLGPAEIQALIDDPAILARLDVVLAFSHFACSEDAAHTKNTEQCQKIIAIKSVLAGQMPKAKWSMCNSSGIFNFKNVLYDVARPGYALYGGNPTPDQPNPMKPVVSLDACVLQTRDVGTGETIGYSATHRFDAPTQTATLCLGYADGILRAASGQGFVYWQGLPCPILGRVSMDLIAVEIGHLKGQRPQAGDMMEVLGPNNGIDQFAAKSGTIGYEILTSLGTRYTRRYINGL